MKKVIFFLLLFLAVNVAVRGAITGSGTLGNPYTGTITTPAEHFAFSGTVYFTNITVSGGTLTINPGTTVIATANDSYLNITANGILNAIGGSGSNMITFTTAVSTWGRISYSSSSSSNINYCIIEKGLTSGYGGGIYCTTSSLSISNSTIRNNHANHGGGIFVDVNASPSISNCIISNNTADGAGGGLFFFSSSGSLVQNCIINNNNSSLNGGGIFLGGYAEDVRIYNCVIASNTRGGSISDNIKFFLNINAVKPRFYNSIVWGGINSINYESQSPSASDFNNCAIQGYASGYTNCINLSGTNGDPTGPNFVDPTNANYSIQFISPCKDAGVTTSPTVPYDIVGNPRIGNYDIGAYEIQYNRWNGSNSDQWSYSTNWDAGVVPSDGDIVIPGGLSNYPTGDPSLNFALGPGKYLVLKPGAKATFNNLTSSGSLILESDASGLSSIITNTNVTATFKMYLTGGGTKTPLTYKWHYISSPVTSLAVSTFAPSVTMDLAQWIEPRPSTSLTQGWVAFDGYIYSTGGMGGPTFSTLDPGKGYDYYKNSDQTFTFNGQLNTGDVTVNLGYTAGDDNLHGYNLLGNPFPSGLDWDYIITNNFPTNTTKSLYFTRNSALCSYINGVGVPGDVTGIIPPMQGFFSKTTSAGNSIVFPAAARTNSSIHATYKGLQIIPLIRLSLTDANETDETVVRFDNLAKSYLDNDFDAVKMFLDPDLTSIYTSLSGTNYAINGLPFPDPSIEIPVTINLTSDALSKSITATQLQGLDNYDVTLKDNSTGYIANLKITPTVTFSAAKGNVSGRFILKIGTITTGVENQLLNYGKFNIYPFNNFINIQTLGDEWDGKIGSVSVMDLTGKIRSYSPKNEFHLNSFVQVEAPTIKGMYIVEIKSGLLKYVGKVVIK